MKMHKRRIVRYGIALACTFGMALSSMPVHATESINSLENQSSSLREQLAGINQELVDISEKILETEAKIEEANTEVFRLEASLQISRNNEERQYDNMKARIRYMYENGTESLISMLFNADSMADFLNKADFIQNVTEYDREMLDNLVKVREGIETQEKDLKEQQEELEDLREDLADEQENLQAKAAATSTDLASLNAKLQAAREAQASQNQVVTTPKPSTPTSGGNTSGGGSSSSSSSDSVNSGSIGGAYVSYRGYKIPASGLTPMKGRIWFNGHTETYYSQRVLPGGGLNIPGRHVAGDGTVRDGSNYIVVASDDYAKGTVVQTSLGTGKVYDCGSGRGNIDLYTDW